MKVPLSRKLYGDTEEQYPVLLASRTTQHCMVEYWAGHADQTFFRLTLAVCWLVRDETSSSLTALSRKDCAAIADLAPAVSRDYRKRSGLKPSGRKNKTGLLLAVKVTLSPTLWLKEDLFLIQQTLALLDEQLS